jgi:hypothetical protein
MDIKNRIHTTGTFWLMRAEHIALLVACAGLMLWHADSVHWLRAFVAFWVIDLVGYLPGAVAYRRRGGGPISPIYHYLYNCAHTYLVVGTGVGVWALAMGEFEWAMLAVPFHLSVDRGVFGNVFKPLALPFEPAATSFDVIAAALGYRPFAVGKGTSV